MRVIEALTVTSREIKRQQITFDEKQGVILQAGDLGFPADQIDFYFDDDCYLFAGMGDVHIHAREDVSGKHTYKEDFLSAQKALRNGGLTHVGDMPNNPVPPVDDKSYEEKLKLALKAMGEIWIYAGIGPETRPLSYPVPYKVYMGPSVGDLFFKDQKTLDETLSHYQGRVVSFHCEDPDVLESFQGEPHHHLRRPIKAEVNSTKDALRMIEKHQLLGKLCHYSSGEGLNLVREARKRGVKVLLEVTPQHLYFSIDEIQEKDFSTYQMNPPLRFKKDRQDLLDALKKGEIDFLATDHAPHTLEEKQLGTSGLTGLDTYGAFVTWLIKEGVDPRQVAKVASENPGDFFNQFLPSWKKISPVFKNFHQGVGYLKEGFRANFTVLHMKRPFHVTKDKLKTKVQHSPFLDVTFPGSVEALFIGGVKI